MDNNNNDVTPKVEIFLPTPEEAKEYAGLVEAENIRLGEGEEAEYVKILPEEGWVCRPKWKWTVSGEEIPDRCLSNVYLSWYLHRMPNVLRWETMNEAFRVLKPLGKCMIVGPHWSSEQAIIDPLAAWPPLTDKSFFVYSRGWRGQRGFTGLPLTCDFACSDQNGNLIVLAGYVSDPSIENRSDDFRTFARQHYNNSVAEMHVTLVKTQ